jgi:hypothetical protein
MHDPVDIRRRIDRLVARVGRRDDYGPLLARGAAIRASTTWTTRRSEPPFCVTATR